MKKTDRDVYEPVMPEDPEKSSLYLDSVLERLKIDIHTPENQLVIQWKAVIPEYISQHCMCAGFKDSVLYVVCDNAAKAGITRLNSREIIKLVNTAFPEFNIKKINIRVKT
jgi:predicted nucleic acid-binding Zn ribbon protein